MSQIGIGHPSPTAVTVPAEVDWLLARALGPEISPSAELPITGLEPLANLVGSSGLLSRARVRTARKILESELTEELRAEVDRAAHRVVALELLQEEVSKELADLANHQGIPIIFLKGLALRSGGHSQPGSRWAGDIDVLVHQDAAAALSDALKLMGSRPVDLQPQEHHLAPLIHPLGGVIEIHTHLIGIRIERRTFATFDDCLSAELCQALDDWPMGIFIQKWELLTAHLLVHSLRQHVYAPATYPQLQLLADLQDLGFAEERGESFLQGGFAWIESEVRREAVQAVRETLQAFERGERASSIASGDYPGAVLLRHMLAGATSEDYRQSLKIAGVIRPVSQRRSLARTMRSLGRALFLTRGQIDLIYGPPRTRLVYLGRRLWRPFDLVIRTFKTLKAQLKLRSRRSKPQ